MAFLSSLNISASGMTAQRLRLDIASENIANIETTRTEDGTPYQRKMVVLESVEGDFQSILSGQMDLDGTKSAGVVVSEIIEDETELTPVYNPSHPDANEDGYVLMPNIDLVKETTDAMAAYRSYEANVTAFNTMHSMAQKALEIGK